MRKTGVAGNDSNNSTTVYCRFTKFNTDIHTGYDVISYFRSAFLKVRKTVENVATYRFLSNFSGAVFLGGLLFELF